MATATPRKRMSYAEYLQQEARADGRHEYLAGEVYAMAGGTPEHAALAISVAAALHAALEGRPCRVFSSDARVRIRATGLATYPDLSVVCGTLETDGEDRDAIVNPVLIVEVLSDSTEAYDRGEKARHYRRIPTLREYVLVSSTTERIDVHRRTDDDRWEIVEAAPGESLKLASLGIAIDVAAIYANPLPRAAT